MIMLLMMMVLSPPSNANEEVSRNTGGCHKRGDSRRGVERERVCLEAEYSTTQSIYSLTFALYTLIFLPLWHHLLVGVVWELESLVKGIKWQRFALIIISYPLFATQSTQFTKVC